ncbi:MAG: TIM barrel protein [Clostridia bacterium]|nr:TIM barrel protein [Clostridia bacterium]
MKKIIQCVPNDEDLDKTIAHINIIKKVGFDGVFLQWYDKNFLKINQQIEKCKSIGLKIEFIHLNYENINNLWINHETTPVIIDEYINKLYICKNHNIETVILHLSAKEKAPPMTNIGINNFKKIVKVAENLDIFIALENTKTPGRFEYLYNNINSENLKLCLDTGHLHCFYKDNINWSFLKDKILTLHIHDNYQIKDNHLLPFDGNTNWHKLISNLQKANYKGNVVLESHYTNYQNLDLFNFYKKSFEKAQKTQQLFKTTTY